MIRNRYKNEGSNTALRSADRISVVASQSFLHSLAVSTIVRMQAGETLTINSAKLLETVISLLQFRTILEKQIGCGDFSPPIYKSNITNGVTQHETPFGGRIVIDARTFAHQLQGKAILNLSHHSVSDAQALDGAVECYSTEYRDLLRFDSIPTQIQRGKRADALVKFAKLHIVPYGINAVLVGGEPYFVNYLERAFTSAGIKTVYSFNSDGMHVGFVEG